MIFVPPEWAPHKAIWTAWPSFPELWPDILSDARKEVAAMVLALAEGDHVKVYARAGEPEESARAALKHKNVTVIPALYGDIWFRDVAPIFARKDNAPVALTFKVNGWGGKYVYEYDDTVAASIAQHSQTPAIAHDFVLEGGAIEFDGKGRLLTTRSCLLNPNRNPSLSQTDIEQRLKDAFGIDRIYWLDKGLLKDHTDGHIDNAARFVGEATVVCQTASGKDDPNADTFQAIQNALREQGLNVVTIPSPGLMHYEDGSIAPASHMNYIIGNKTVVVPIYEDRYSVEALEKLRGIFPAHTVVGLPAMNILTGGGSFHCITQQEPA